MNTLRDIAVELSRNVSVGNDLDEDVVGTMIGDLLLSLDRSLETLYRKEHDGITPSPIRQSEYWLNNFHVLDDYIPELVRLYTEFCNTYINHMRTRTQAV